MTDEAADKRQRKRNGAVIFIVIVVALGVAAALAAAALTVREVVKEPPLAGTWTATRSEFGEEFDLLLVVDETGEYTLTGELLDGGHIDAARGVWYQQRTGLSPLSCTYEFRDDGNLELTGPIIGDVWKRIGDADPEGDAVEPKLVGTWERPPLMMEETTCIERLSIPGSGDYTRTTILSNSGTMTLHDGTWTTDGLSRRSGTYEFTTPDTLVVTDDGEVTVWTRVGVDPFVTPPQ
jgi:hypothetical protein